MTTDTNAVIKVEGLEKSFGDNHVLKGIDIEIDKGEVIVVIGASGSGKSTFLRCLNCLEDPTGGHIYFDGVDIADMTVRTLRANDIETFDTIAMDAVLENGAKVLFIASHATGFAASEEVCPITSPFAKFVTMKS